MAERHQLKVADPVDLGADDPFAELTRIMGLDPRRPDMAPTARNAGPQPVETAEDDFGIDLEQELLGELEAEDAVEGSSGTVAAEPGFDARFDAGLTVSEDAGQSRGWSDWDPPALQDAAGTEDAAFDAAVAEEDFDEAFASEDLAGGESASSADLDADELAREFAQALEEGGEEASLEPRQFGADPAGSPSSEFQVADAPAEELRELDLAAEEFLADQPLGEFAGDIDRDVAAGEVAAPGRGGEPALPRAWLAEDPDEAAPTAAGFEQAGQWDQPLLWHDAGDELEDHFAGIDLAADETSEGFSEPADPLAAGEEAEEREDVAAASAEPSDPQYLTGAPYAVAPTSAAGNVLAESSGSHIEDPDPGDADVVYNTDQWVDALGWTGDEAAGHGEAADPASVGEMEVAAGPGRSATLDVGHSGAVVAGDPTRAGAWAAAAASGQLVSSAAVAAEPPLAEFSLEDELNALLGNIRAAGRRSAATTQALRSWGGAAPAAAGSLPGSRERTAFDAQRPAPPREVDTGDRGWEKASNAPREDLPGLDDEAFGAALAEGLGAAEFVAGKPDGEQLSSRSVDETFDAMAAVAAGAGPKPNASWSRENARPVPRAAPAAGSARAGEEEIDFGDAVFDGAPEIDTVEVAERPVALADDLDIPELDYREAGSPAAAYDDLDAEFASLLDEMNLDLPAQQPAGAPVGEAHAVHEHADLSAPSEGPLPGTGQDADADWFELDANDLAGSMSQQYDSDGVYPGAPSMVRPAAEPRRRRGLLFAGVVGAVAVAGGVGALALSSGGFGGDAPVLVKADPSPVKVRPANPGGTTVPNQDNAVYESVVGVAPGAQPKQEKLVTTAEEPIDVSPPISEEAEELPGLSSPDAETAAPQPKGEDRIAEILQEAEEAEQDAAVTAVAPRKVRTIVVKPDGTLVPREEPAIVEDIAAAAADATLAAANADGTAVAAVTEAIASLPEAGTEPAAQLPAAEQEQPAGSLVMPDVAPIAPQRPAEQPIDAVGEVKRDQVAAAAPAAPSAVVAPAAPSAAAAPAVPPTAGGAAWSVQIASQPNEAAARSTYQDLAGRYAGVLAGRQVDIVKADIAGKGTFWRVRVPADSRSEAIRLCESYKEAGGNCFVSR